MSSLRFSIGLSVRSDDGSRQVDASLAAKASGPSLGGVFVLTGGIAQWESTAFATPGSSVRIRLPPLCGTVGRDRGRRSWGGGLGQKPATGNTPLAASWPAAIIPTLVGCSGSARERYSSSPGFDSFRGDRYTQSIVTVAVLFARVVEEPIRREFRVDSLPIVASRAPARGPVAIFDNLVVVVWCLKWAPCWAPLWRCRVWWLARLQF